MLRSIGKQSGESVESVVKKERKAAVGRKVVFSILWHRCVDVRCNFVSLHWHVHSIARTQCERVITQQALVVSE